MKYNSIGEQLIAKAKELDPNYKPDKFNDMSEAIDIILNNTGGDNYIDLVFSYQWLMDHMNGYDLTIPANTITEDMLLQMTSGKKKGLLLKIQGPENEEVPDLIFLTIALELDITTGQLASNITILGDQVGYWTLPLEDLSQDQICKFNLIENSSGGLTVPELPSDASSKTYVLQAVNGTLIWVEGSIGDINSILDNINGEVI